MAASIYSFSLYVVFTFSVFAAATQASCPPEKGIYLMIKDKCINNGTYFRDSDLQIAKEQDGYIHCVLPGETLDGGQWMRPDGEPVDCDNGISSRTSLSATDPKLKNPFFCTDSSPSANITMYLEDDDYFKPTAYINGKPVSDFIETEYKCCLPTPCSSASTNIMTINVYERIYIVDVYFDLPDDVSIIPQSYTVHCIVTGSISSGSIKQYYDDNELSSSQCSGQLGYSCSHATESITTNYTYSDTVDYTTTVNWEGIKIVSGLFRQSKYNGDHKLFCKASNAKITPEYTGRTKSVVVRAPGSAPTIISDQVNKTHASITISWDYADLSDADGYIVNASTVDNSWIIKVTNSTQSQVTLDKLSPGMTYNITVRAYQDLLGPASDTVSITTLNDKPNITWSKAPFVMSLLNTPYTIQCNTSSVSPALVYWSINEVKVPNTAYMLINKAEMIYTSELSLTPNIELRESVNVTCSIEGVSNTTLMLKAPTEWSQDINVKRINETSINISVIGNKQPDEMISGFVVSIAPSGHVYELTPTPHDVLVTDLLLGTLYSIQVYAFKDLLSAPINRTMFLNYTNVPSAVNSVSTTPLLSQFAIPITWASSDEYKVTYYRIEYNLSSCSAIVSDGVVDVPKGHYHYNISGLLAGKDYTISVREGNPIGLSDPVTIVIGTLPAEPSAAPDPGSILLDPVDETTYDLTWKGLPCTQQNGMITGYILHIENNITTYTIHNKERSLKITVPLSSLSIKIAATNVAGVGPFSDTRIFNLQETIGPVNINYLTADDIESSWAHMSWTPPSHIPDSYPVVSYELGVYSTGNQCSNHFNRSMSGEVVLVNISHEALEYNASDLMPNTCYVFAIRAYTTIGCGPWTSVSFRTTTSTEATHRSIQCNNQDTNMSLAAAIETTLPLSGSLVAVIVIMLVTIISLIIVLIVINKRGSKKKTTEVKYVYEDMHTKESYDDSVIDTKDGGKTVEPMYETIPPLKEKKRIEMELELRNTYINKDCKYEQIK